MIIQVETYYGNDLFRIQIDGNFNFADEDIDVNTGDKVIRIQRED